jgi:hypothetical protein
MRPGTRAGVPGPSQTSDMLSIARPRRSVKPAGGAVRRAQINGSYLDFRNAGPLTHREACKWLACQFEITRSLHSDPGVREDLFQALAKVNALKPQAAAQWTIIIPGRGRPVQIALVPWKSREPDAPGL